MLVELIPIELGIFEMDMEYLFRKIVKGTEMVYIQYDAVARVIVEAQLVAVDEGCLLYTSRCV